MPAVTPSDPVMLVLPLTVNLAFGDVVPIPTFPDELMRIASSPPSTNPIVSAAGKYMPVLRSPRAAIPGDVAEPELKDDWPCTVKLASGEFKPTPTLPSAFIRMRSAVLFVKNCKSLFETVPKDAHTSSGANDNFTPDELSKYKVGSFAGLPEICNENCGLFVPIPTSSVAVLTNKLVPLTVRLLLTFIVPETI